MTYKNWIKSTPKFEKIEKQKSNWLPLPVTSLISLRSSYTRPTEQVFWCVQTMKQSYFCIQKCRPEKWLNIFKSQVTVFITRVFLSELVSTIL